MADPKDPTDLKTPKDLNQQAPRTTRARPAEPAEISDDDLEKLVGGVARGGQLTSAPATKGP